MGRPKKATPDASRLQARLSAEVTRRIRLAAVRQEVAPGAVVTALVMQHLDENGKPINPITPTKETTPDGQDN